MENIIWFNKKWVKISLHILIWIVYLIYPFFYHKTTEIDRQLVIRALLPFVLIMALFYINFHLLIPCFLGTKKVGLYLGIVLVFVIVYVFVSVITQKYFNPIYNSKDIYFHYTLASAVISVVTIWGVSSGLRLTREWFRSQKRKQELEKERLKAELGFLKSQVNPHFLFNALNAIYALASMKSVKTADAVMQLSEIMRYVLYDAASTRVPLEQEIKCLKSYIDLQKTRWNDIPEIKFNAPQDTTGKMIAPLLLLPFVENAFKHGISAHQPSYIHIDLSVDNNNLKFKVENSVVNGNSHPSGTSGIGLTNVKRRLALTYHDNAQLDIHEENNAYIVDLKLDINV